MRLRGTVRNEDIIGGTVIPFGRTLIHDNTFKDRYDGVFNTVAYRQDAEVGDNRIILVSSVDGDRMVTLPDAETQTLPVWVRATDTTNDITVRCVKGQTINGSATYSLTAAIPAIMLVPYRNEWWTVATGG